MQQQSLNLIPLNLIQTRRDFGLHGEAAVLFMLEANDINALRQEYGTAGVDAWTAFTSY
ncbi:hypothetical protein QG061_05410 [Kingella kingae]|uniref:hypothetical protein n=1 Tax=Kingella kingae TaxID=504 RepID=UPI00254FBA3E|nr:hypothetical protein [Kingella kingae]MDK4674406.1 hypothetical protein [Kingella kingae]